MIEIDASEDEVDDLREQLAGARQLVISDARLSNHRQTVEPWLVELGKVGRATLERLIVDTQSQPLTRQASVDCGDITEVFRACPNLSFAFVIGRAEIASLAHDRLEDLTLMGDPLTPATITAVVTGRTPKLKKLALGLSYEFGAADGADAALIDALARKPALEELHIGYPEDPPALLAALARLPLERLRVLSIAGSMSDDVLGILREHDQRLGTLEALYLETEDILDYTDAQLAELFPALRTIEDIEPFSWKRYRT